MRTDPDAQLMLQFKAGDQRAFHDLFDKYKKRVIGYCYRYCGQAAVAEELAQETFLRVYKAAPRYKPKARFSTWLFKIAANVCLNELRRPMYRNPTDSLDEQAEEGRTAADTAAPASEQPSQPDALLASREKQAMVQQAIATLPDQQRAALLLRVNGEFSYREIGEQIGRSEGHVKTLIYRGRQQLKKRLGAYFGENHD